MHVHIYVHAFILHLNIHACIFIIFVVIRTSRRIGFSDL